jgi:acyl-coenzyme A thioesterase PaaI-like protein
LIDSGSRSRDTIAMQINYLNAVAGEDAIAEAWVERRGRSLAFCRVAVRTACGTLATSASLVYKT